jgi:hypothetical protein
MVDSFPQTPSSNPKKWFLLGRQYTYQILQRTNNSLGTTPSCLDYFHTPFRQGTANKAQTNQLQLPWKTSQQGMSNTRSQKRRQPWLSRSQRDRYCNSLILPATMNQQHTVHTPRSMRHQCPRIAYQLGRAYKLQQPQTPNTNQSGRWNTRSSRRQRSSRLHTQSPEMTRGLNQCWCFDSNTLPHRWYSSSWSPRECYTSHRYRQSTNQHCWHPHQDYPYRSQERTGCIVLPTPRNTFPRDTLILSRPLDSNSQLHNFDSRQGFFHIVPANCKRLLTPQVQSNTATSVATASHTHRM